MVMVMVANRIRSGGGTFAILQRTTQHDTMQCDGGVAVMVRAVEAALAMV